MGTGNTCENLVLVKIAIPLCSRSLALGKSEFRSQGELLHLKLAVAAIKLREDACFEQCSPFSSWHRLPAVFKQMLRGIVQNWLSVGSSQVQMFLHKFSGNTTAQVRKKQSLAGSEAPVTIQPCPDLQMCWSSRADCLPLICPSSCS